MQDKKFLSYLKRVLVNDRTVRWAKRELLVYTDYSKIGIHAGPDYYSDATRKAFEAWSEALDNEIIFTFITEKKKADIVDFLGAIIKSDVIRYFSEEGNSYAAKIHEIAEAQGKVISADELETIREPFDRGLFFLKNQMHRLKP